MKKTGQALFLILFMLAGSRDSVATDAAGAVPETHKRINLNSTPDSSKKTDPQNKKQPGWFNRCTQSFYNKVTWMQEYYNALDSTDQNTIKFLAILAAVGAMTALRVYAGGSKPEEAQECSIDDLEKVEDLSRLKDETIQEVRKIQSKIGKQQNTADDLEELKTYRDDLDAIEKDLIAIPEVCRDKYKLAKIFGAARTFVNGVENTLTLVNSIGNALTLGNSGGTIQLPSGDNSRIADMQQSQILKSPLEEYNGLAAVHPSAEEFISVNISVNINLNLALQAARQALENNPEFRSWLMSAFGRSFMVPGAAGA